MRPGRGRCAAFLAVLAGALAVPAGAASAHPLGNFTVNTYSGLRVAGDRVAVEFLVDMAEIPTLQRMRDLDGDGDGSVAPPEGAAYAERECPVLARHLELRVDDRVVALAVAAAQVTLGPGQAGLNTLRITCGLEASAAGGSSGERHISFSSANFTDRAGWREITAVGDGTTLVASDVPTASVSERLTNYPADLLASPLDQRTATLVARPGGQAARAAVVPAPARSGPLPRGVDRATRAFTSFVGRQDLTIGFAALAVLASIALGAVHALAPGHGKTVMAAYLVGQRGSFRQAMAIALTVTATHTAGVLALGIAISASAVVAPERLYPWLGAASGALLALLGIAFLVRITRVRGRARPEPIPGDPQPVSPGHAGHDHAGHDHAAHDHTGHGDHGHGDHGHDHAAHDHTGHDHTGHGRRGHGDHTGHGDHGHAHGGRAHRHGPLPADGLVTWRGLLAMGFVGGLLPSPSAVVVLLGAMALGRTWFGVLLVVAYGLGMAATLAAAGLLLLRARGLLDGTLARFRRNRMLAATTRLLPLATAGFILLVGLYLAARGAAQI